MKNCIWIAMLLAIGCQDYGFEEAPSSTIHIKRVKYDVSVSSEIDILFVIDNSLSMVGEQTALGESFKVFTDILDRKFGLNKYQIAVVTTGVGSPACGPCKDEFDSSCINETGEAGRFQSRRGQNVGTVDAPVYKFDPEDPACRIITSRNLGCFFEEVAGVKKGIVFTGIQGCGYERGLEAVRMALSAPLKDGANGGFLREGATLAVVVVSDEEDCGKVGDTTESLDGIRQNICYYASKGVSPDGKTVDPNHKPLALSPVSTYYDFLTELRGSGVKFAAITGVRDEANPATTEIIYESQAPDANVLNACKSPNCSGIYCGGEPGTRYIKLAQMFGTSGFVASICKDFSATLEALADWLPCPDKFRLSEPILDAGLASILIDNESVPTYSCADQANPVKCSGETDVTCPNGKACVRTWNYMPPSNPPNPHAPGGEIEFASHYNPCSMKASDFRLELVYATP